MSLPSLIRRIKMAAVRRYRLVRLLEFPADAWTAIRVATVALFVTFALRFGMDRRLLEFVDKKRTAIDQQDSPSSSAHVARIVRVTDIVLQTGKPLLRSECLTRSLVLSYLLTREGFAVAIEFGVSNDQQSFASHCWLIHDDDPVFEDGNPRTEFNVIHRIGGNQP